jgi:hypothetical protein
MSDSLRARISPPQTGGEVDDDEVVKGVIEFGQLVDDGLDLILVEDLDLLGLDLGWWLYARHVAGQDLTLDRPLQRPVQDPVGVADGARRTWHRISAGWRATPRSHAASAVA